MLCGDSRPDELDTRPSPAQATAFEAALQERGVAHEVSIYAGVGHAFITPHAHRDPADPTHSQAVAAGSKPKPWELLDGDTSVSASSLSAALCAVLSCCFAVDACCDPHTAHRNAFAVIRPPGHHAGANGPTVGPESFAQVSAAANEHAQPAAQVEVGRKLADEIAHERQVQQRVAKTEHVGRHDSEFLMG